MIVSRFGKKLRGLLAKACSNCEEIAVVLLAVSLYPIYRSMSQNIWYNLTTRSEERRVGKEC